MEQCKPFTTNYVDVYNSTKVVLWPFQQPLVLLFKNILCLIFFYDKFAPVFSQGTPSFVLKTDGKKDTQTSACICQILSSGSCIRTDSCCPPSCIKQIKLASKRFKSTDHPLLFYSSVGLSRKSVAICFSSGTVEI